MLYSNFPRMTDTLGNKLVKAGFKYYRRPYPNASFMMMYGANKDIITIEYHNQGNIHIQQRIRREVAGITEFTVKDAYMAMDKMEFYLNAFLNIETDIL